jgi:hypothetical protein
MPKRQAPRKEERSVFIVTLVVCREDGPSVRNMQLAETLGAAKGADGKRGHQKGVPEG